MNVLIVSSQTLFAWGIQHLFNLFAEEGENNVHYQHVTFDTFHPILSNNSDLLVIDLTEGTKTAVQIADDLKQVTSPSIGFVNPEFPISITEAQNIDLAGVIHNDAPKKLALSVLNLILSGGKYLPLDSLCDYPYCHKSDNRSSQVKQALSLRFKSLSIRQIDVLYWISQGLSNKQIANTLNISVATVKAHSNAAFKILNVRSRTEASLVIWSAETTTDNQITCLRFPTDPTKVVELT